MTVNSFEKMFEIMVPRTDNLVFNSRVLQAEIFDYHLLKKRLLQNISDLKFLSSIRKPLSRANDSTLIFRFLY